MHEVPFLPAVCPSGGRRPAGVESGGRIGCPDCRRALLLGEYARHAEGAFRPHGLWLDGGEPARFAPSFLRLVERGADQIFAPDSALFALYGGASSALHVGEGGVFGALWELARRTDAGLEADLKKIPVLQETVEVCELFHINPYQLTSAGCFLMTAPDGEALREKLETAGIRAAVIGRLRPDRDKILRNGEEIRYIDRPAPDEIGKLWERERQEE